MRIRVFVAFVFALLLVSGCAAQQSSQRISEADIQRADNAADQAEAAARRAEAAAEKAEVIFHKSLQK